MSDAIERDTVLFLCVANSARSQMAEGWGRAMAPDGVNVMSAGSAPASVNPHAIAAMDEVDIDISGHQSKSVDDVPRDRIRVAVTLCADEVCPVFPGDVETLHWPHEDPAAAEGSEDEIAQAFRRVRDQIKERLRALFRDEALFP